MEDIEQVVKRLIIEHSASSWSEADLYDDLSFLDDGLGLDSVEVVELLFACENQFDIRISPELIEESPFTIGKLIMFIKTGYDALRIAHQLEIEKGSPCREGIQISIGLTASKNRYHKGRNLCGAFFRYFSG